MSVSSRLPKSFAGAVLLLALTMPTQGLAQNAAQAQPQLTPEQLQAVAREAARRARTETATALANAYVAMEVQKVREPRGNATVVFPDALSGAPLNGAALVAGSEGKRAIITATLPASKLSEFAIRVSAPLSEDEPRSAIVSASGLANKGNVDLEWRYGQQRLPSRRALNGLAMKLLDACLANNPEPIGTLTENGISLQGCDLVTLESDQTVSDSLKALFSTTQSWFVSIKGGLGRQTFDFVNSAFDDESQKTWSKSAAATFGWLTTGNVYLAAGGRFERGFEASKTQAVCNIAALATETACPNKVVGPPTPKLLKIMEAEIRKYLPVPDALQFQLGLSGIVRHDFEEGTTSVEVPVYFIKDKDGGLSGGVSSGYVWSDDDKVKGPRFTVFVGQAFSFGL